MGEALWSEIARVDVVVGLAWVGGAKPVSRIVAGMDLYSGQVRSAIGGCLSDVGL